MKRLDTLLATVLDEIANDVIDYSVVPNQLKNSYFVTDKFDVHISYNVSIQYQTLDQTYNNVEAIESITLNSAHVTKITTDLQSDLPNVRKLLNEKLINYENKKLPL